MSGVIHLRTCFCQLTDVSIRTGERDIAIVGALLEQGAVGSGVASEPQSNHIGPPMGAETVGDRLRRFRRLRRLSQEQLAELAGVRQNYIAQLERGATEVPRDPGNLTLLAKALKVRLRDLAEPTGWYADDEPSSDDWRSGLMADDRLDESAKQFLDKAITLAFEAAERADKPTPERKKRAG